MESLFYCKYKKRGFLSYLYSIMKITTGCAVKACSVYVYQRHFEGIALFFPTISSKLLPYLNYVQHDPPLHATSRGSNP